MPRPADDTIRMLNEPRPLHVLANTAGVPKLLSRADRQADVVEILDVWRIDDAWWRDEIARCYLMVLLDDGTEASIYHDLVSGQWFEQRY